MRATCLRLLLLVSLSLPATGCAHQIRPGEMWNLWGTVTDFSPTQLSVKHKTGRIWILQIDSATVFTNEKQPATASALAKRARVSVDVEFLGNGRERAKAVRIVWGGRTNDQEVSGR